MKNYITLSFGVVVWSLIACYAFSPLVRSDAVLGFCLPYAFTMASMILAILLLESRFWNPGKR